MGRTTTRLLPLALVAGEIRLRLMSIIPWVRNFVFKIVSCFLQGLFLVSTVNAQTLVESRPPLKLSVVPVRWYRPEFVKPLPGKRHQIVIQGVTFKGARVTLGVKIPFFKEGHIETSELSKKDIIKDRDSTVIADGKGFFSFTVDLPYGVVHLPISVEYRGSITPYVPIIKVLKDDLKIVGESRLETSPFYKKKFGFWAGTGFNYITYKQGDFSFQSLSLPSQYLKFWYEIIPYLELNVSAKSSPGEVSSGAAVSVLQGGYSWDNLGVEASYSPESFETELFGLETLFGVIGGVQYHLVPYVVQVGVNQASIRTNEVIMGSLGGRALLIQSRRWEYEVFLRYQHVVSSGDLFDIGSSFAFDGSLGAIYRFKNRSWRLGAFSYGQYFSYQTTRINTVTLARDRLDHSLFFSNIELRLGYEF